MERIKRKKCRNCKKLFVPDPRNRKKQKYCSKPECRGASKKASQEKWLSKPQNKNYFRGPTNVARVMQWREQNPEYRKRKPEKDKNVLQDHLIAQPAENKEDKAQNASFVLQDFLIMQPSVIIGLIANFTGHVLQDDISKTLLSMQQLGLDILNDSTQNKGGKNDCQIPDNVPSSSQSSQKLQLD